MNFIFYDTETTGIDRYFGQILQFAGVLTNERFEELDRFNIRCRLMPHIVPAPGALRATRITPAMLTDRALPSHYEAMCQIADKLRKWSPACFAGYNSLAFDEPILRQAFYQALQPIFLTNTGGNTRADIYRLVQAVSIHAPNAIVIPLDAAGNRSRRLDAVAPANGFDHRDAHEAMADVQATIFMARLIRERTPALWETLMALNAKGPTLQRALSGSRQILTEIFGKSAYVRHVIACGQNPDYDAQVGFFDLSFDPSSVIDHSVDELIDVLNGHPKPIRVIQANNQPILLPLDFAPRHEVGSELDEELLDARAAAIRSSPDFQTRVGQAIAKRFPPGEPVKYVEQKIFEGFYDWNDNQLMEQFHHVDWEARPEIVSRIGDRRARELGYRIIYLHKPELLDPKIREWFRAWESERLTGDGEDLPYLTIPNAIGEAQDLLEEGDAADTPLLEDVLTWLEGQSPRNPTTYRSTECGR